MADTFALKGGIIDRISSITDPLSSRSLLDAHMIEDVQVESDGKATVRIQFSEAHTREHRWTVEDAVADAVESLEGITGASVVGFTPALRRRPPRLAQPRRRHRQRHRHLHPPAKPLRLCRPPRPPRSRASVV